MSKKIISIVMIIILLFCLTSCFGDNGTYEELNAMREEFSKYGGRDDLAFELGECISFNGRRFMIENENIEAASEKIEEAYIYNDNIYYSVYDTNSVKFVTYKKYQIYKCDLYGENSELVYDSGWIRCKNWLEGYFVSYPRPSFYYEYHYKDVTTRILYDIPTGEISNLDAEPDESGSEYIKYGITIDANCMIVSWTDKETGEFESKSFYDMLSKYQASVDKFEFYFGWYLYIRHINSVFFVYETDMYVGGHFPKLVFELDPETVEFRYVGYFENYRLEYCSLIANHKRID